METVQAKTGQAPPRQPERPTEESAPFPHQLPSTLDEARNIVITEIGSHVPFSRPTREDWYPLYSPSIQIAEKISWLRDSSLMHQMHDQCRQVYDETTDTIFTGLCEWFFAEFENRFGTETAIVMIQRYLIAAEFLLFSINYPIPQHEIVKDEEQRTRKLGIITTSEGFVTSLIVAVLQQVPENGQSHKGEILEAVHNFLCTTNKEVHFKLDVIKITTAVQRSLDARACLCNQQFALINQHIQKYHLPNEVPPDDFFSPVHVFSTHLELTGQRGPLIQDLFSILEESPLAGVALCVGQVVSLEHRRSAYGTMVIQPNVPHYSIANRTGYEETLFDAYLALPLMTLCELMFDYGVIYYHLGELYLQCTSPMTIRQTVIARQQALSMRVQDPEHSLVYKITPDLRSTEGVILALADAVQLAKAIGAFPGTARTKSTFSAARKSTEHPMFTDHSKVVVALREQVVAGLRGLGIDCSVTTLNSLETMRHFAEHTGLESMAEAFGKVIMARAHLAAVRTELANFSGTARRTRGVELMQSPPSHLLEAISYVKSTVPKGQQKELGAEPLAHLAYELTLTGLKDEYLHLGIVPETNDLTSLKSLAELARVSGHIELSDYASRAYAEERFLSESDLRGRTPLSVDGFSMFLNDSFTHTLREYWFDDEGVTLIMAISPQELASIQDRIVMTLEHDLGCTIIGGRSWADPYYHALHLNVVFAPREQEGTGPIERQYLRVIEIKIITREEAWVGGADHVIYNIQEKYLYQNSVINEPVLLAASAYPNLSLRDRIQLGERLGDVFLLRVTNQKDRVLSMNYHFDLESRTLCGMTPADLLVTIAQSQGLTSQHIIGLLLNPYFLSVHGAACQRQDMYTPIPVLRYLALERVQRTGVSESREITTELATSLYELERLSLVHPNHNLPSLVQMAITIAEVIGTDPRDLAKDIHSTSDVRKVLGRVDHTVLAHLDEQFTDTAVQERVLHLVLTELGSPHLMFVSPDKNDLEYLLFIYARAGDQTRQIIRDFIRRSPLRFLFSELQSRSPKELIPPDTPFRSVRWAINDIFLRGLCNN